MYTSFGGVPEVIIVAVLTFPLMLVAVVPFARMARRRSQASRASGSNTTSNIEEGMSKVLAVQSLGGNKREGQRFRQVSEESFKFGIVRSGNVVRLVIELRGSVPHRSPMTIRLRTHRA